MADSRSDCMSVFCLCTIFTEFRTLLLAFRWGPGWSLLWTLLTVLTGKVTGGIAGPSVCTLSMGVETEDNSCEQASAPLFRILFVFAYFFCSWLIKPDVTAIFTPSCNLHSFFIHWFAAPPPNDKGLFSAETLLRESWKNIAFSHLASATN